VNIEKIYRDCGAYLRGHFLLSSGNHSEFYLQSAKVLEDPRLAGQLADELGEIFPGEYRCTDAVDLGGDGDDEAQLIVCGLEFELTVLRRQVDTGEDGGLRFGGESLADGLQGGDEVISPECDVHMVSFPMDGRAFVRAVFSFSMGTV